MPIVTGASFLAGRAYNPNRDGGPVGVKRLRVAHPRIVILTVDEAHVLAFVKRDNGVGRLDQLYSAANEGSNDRFLQGQRFLGGHNEAWKQRQVNDRLAWIYIQNPSSHGLSNFALDVLAVLCLHKTGQVVP